MKNGYERNYVDFVTPEHYNYKMMRNDSETLMENQPHS